jgi:hypothetical protein
MPLPAALGRKERDLVLEKSVDQAGDAHFYRDPIVVTLATDDEDLSWISIRF